MANLLFIDSWLSFTVFSSGRDVSKYTLQDVGRVLELSVWVLLSTWCEMVVFVNLLDLPLPFCEKYKGARTRKVLVQSYRGNALHAESACKDPRNEIQGWDEPLRL